MLAFEGPAFGLVAPYEWSHEYVFSEEHVG